MNDNTWEGLLSLFFMLFIPLLYLQYKVIIKPVKDKVSELLKDKGKR